MTTIANDPATPSDAGGDSGTVSIDIGLGEGEHQDAFVRALCNVLATDIAEITFAQLIDGLPLAEVAFDTAGGKLPNKHPIHTEHRQLCPGVLEKTREIRETFNPKSLRLSSEVVSEYRRASPGSRAFKVRLIEMIAIAVHQIAVEIFKMDESLHKDDGLAAWVPPKEDLFWRFNPEGAYATLFRHPWYTDHDQYPNGVADMAGYWAESRIFGGVVLFDRRSPDSAPDVQKDSVWFHPDREDVTYRIVQLSEDQKQQLLGFLTSDSPSLSLLPILVDGENTRREDPEEPLHDTGIYRDLWERKPMGPDDIDRRLRDVWDTVEYPLMSDFERAQERAYDRKDML